MPTITTYKPSQFYPTVSTFNYLESTNRPLITSFYGSYLPPLNRRDRPASYPAFSQSTTSVNTPGFFAKKIVRVKWISKKFPLVPPRPPRRFNPPRLPVPPVLKKGREKSYAKAYALYFKRFEIVKSKRSDYIRRFNLHVAKYTKRLGNYERLSLLERNGRLSLRRVRSSSAHPLPQNPYSRSTIINSGWYGRLEIYTCETLKASPPWNAYGPGPYIGTANVRVWKGTPNHPNAPTTVYNGDHPAMYHLQPTTNAMILSDIKAKSKLYSKLNDQEVHIGNMLAERAQTVKMLSDILVRVVSFFKNPLTLARYISASGFSRRLSDDFLAFKFGLEPLIKDAYALATAFDKLPRDGDLVQFRAGGLVERQNDLTASSSANGDRYNKTTVVRERVSTHYVVNYRVDNAALSTLQSFGLVNPAEIAWEVMPWSFVIDWFLPIGKYISNLGADAGLTFVNGTKTIVSHRTFYTNLRFDMSFFGTYNHELYKGGLTCSRTEISKVRSVLGTAPSKPPLQFKSPISNTHILEALALTRQRFR